MAFQPKVGEILLNKYETISPLGDGAFGSVWRARDIKLDRIVAVKFINSTGGVISRFSDELEAIKNLDHPNIVKLYDFDILRGGTPCIVMELVNGREIGDILMREGPFSCQRLSNIILQVVDALVETHKHNIVHCDLKPENIMLTNVGARNDVVKLIDFGVASIMSKDEEDADKKRMIVGTPQYMAPEQIRREELGPWTDIYALGLIMIELFTGQFVFDHEDPREVLRMQLHNPVVIPPDLACTALGPIIARAVEKDSSKRYQSTQEFYNDLRTASRSMTMMFEPAARARLDSTIINRDRMAAEISDDEDDDFLSDLDDFDSMMDGGAKSAPTSGRSTSRGSSKIDESAVPMPDFSSISTESLKSVSRGNSGALKIGGKEKAVGRVMIESQLNHEDSGESYTVSTNIVLADLKNAASSTKSGEFAMPKGGAENNSVLKKDLTVEDYSFGFGVAKKGTVLSTKQKQPNVVRPIVVFALILAMIVAAAIAWSSGLLEEHGIVAAPTEEVAAPVVVEPEPQEAVITFSALRKVAEKMAYVGTISGRLGASSNLFKNVASYRVFGTPVQADVYVNDRLICMQSPCTINIYGDPSKIQIDLTHGGKSTARELGSHDSDKPIVMVLGK